MPTFTIETGTISNTVLSYAENLVTDWDYYILFDSSDSGNDEEYVLICSGDYENDSFLTPVVYQFKQIQITDSHNHPTNTYQINRFEYQIDIPFPSNNQNLCVYSNVPDSYYPNFNRGVEKKCFCSKYVRNLSTSF